MYNSFLIILPIIPQEKYFIDSHEKKPTILFKSLNLARKRYFLLLKQEILRDT